MSPQAARSASRTQNAILDEWVSFTKPTLERMLNAGLDIVSAMEDRRIALIWAGDVVRHDAAAVDLVAWLLDYLSDEVGSARKAADEAGLDPDCITLDRSELETAHARLSERAKHRRVA